MQDQSLSRRCPRALAGDPWIIVHDQGLSLDAFVFGIIAPEVHLACGRSRFEWGLGATVECSPTEAPARGYQDLADQQAAASFNLSVGTALEAGS